MPTSSRVIQVLVYAGAVMVLFLFIIMLLDLKAEAAAEIQRRRLRRRAALVALDIRRAGLRFVLGRFPRGKPAFSGAESAAGESSNDVRESRRRRSSRTHNLPFQVIGVLILVATIGVVVLSKRELK